jgi:hypothetical protein
MTSSNLTQNRHGTTQSWIVLHWDSFIIQSLYITVCLKSIQIPTFCGQDWSPYLGERIRQKTYSIWPEEADHFCPQSVVLILLEPLRTVRPIYPPDVAFYIFFLTNVSTQYFKHAAHPLFFSSKCRLFHNATFFGSCIIYILHTGCAKI